ncbi:Insulin-like growth factor-binding protein 4, partial [Dryobates pubescens]
CGVYTARCGAGLRCYPPRGVPRPLHTLMHGQGVCTDLADVEAIQESLHPPALGWLPGHPSAQLEPCNRSLQPASAPGRRCLKPGVAAGKRVLGGCSPAAGSTPPFLQAQGSCQSELHRALERLAASQTRTHEDLYVIPIPNCDRNGNFHPKQCHPALDGQRGKCWCVDRKTGVKLPGFLELKGDLDCHQLADSM